MVTNRLESIKEAWKSESTWELDNEDVEWLIEQAEMLTKETHIDNFLYEMDTNENGEIPCLIEINGVEHSFEITERDVKNLSYIFLSKSK